MNPQTKNTLPSYSIFGKVVSGRTYSLWIGGAATFFFSLGLLWHILPFTTALVRPLTPYMLLVFGALVLAPFIAMEGYRMLLWSVMSYAAGFTLEAAGVATGAIFGPYEYSSVLGKNIFRVPPIIGFNWIVVIAGCAALAAFLIDRSRLAFSSAAQGKEAALSKKLHGIPGILAVAVLAGILAAAFDWVMEPAAIALGYWNWLVPEIPLRNYMTWFLFSAVSAGVWAALVRNPDRKFPLQSWYLLVQILFFAGIRLAIAFGVLF